ncbi:hypothetical protein ACQZV8_15510 [Magnetococcales bacterium HHB-1]
MNDQVSTHSKILEITLKQNVVLSSTSATAGEHTTLQYIPGQKLLGVALGRLYRKYGQEKGYEILRHANFRDFSFGHGYPRSPLGYVSYPMPLIWYYDKYDTTPLSDDGLLNAETIYNKSVEELEKIKGQKKQLREGFVSIAGEMVYPKHAYNMKTAIDATTGRSAEGQLFGYQSLSSGQTFLSLISSGGRVHKKTFDKVTAVLKQDFALGRSRSAEFGAVSGTLKDVAKDTYFIPPSNWDNKNNRDNKKEITIWLLSDLCLLDDYGLPAIEPKATDFALPSGELIKEKSALRFRRYTTYNNKWRHNEQERLVIQQGSVLHFKLDNDRSLTLEEIKNLPTSVGLYQQQGFGQIAFNPELLVTPKDNLGELFEKYRKDRIKPTKSAAPEKPQHHLANWLQQRVDGEKGAQELSRLALEQSKTVKKLYQSARRRTGKNRGEAVGPSVSQWGHVYDLAKKHRHESLEKLSIALFIGDKAVCVEKSGGQGWKEQATMISDDHRDIPVITSFLDWFKEIFEQKEGRDDAKQIQLIMELAWLAKNVAKEENR